MRNIKPAKIKSVPPTLSVVIIAAGCGTKTRSFGPKSLLDYHHKTVIEHQINTIYNVYPDADIIIVVGFEYQKLYKKLSTKYPNLKYVYIEDYENRGQGFSIINGCLAATSSNILIIYGDIIFNKFTINKLPKDKSYVLCDTKNKINKDKVGVHANDGIVAILQHGIKTKWAQIVILSTNEINMVKGLLCNKDSYRWMGYEILNYIIRNGGELRSIEFPRQDLFEINGLQDTLQ
jgi:choline kinase